MEYLPLFDTHATQKFTAYGKLPVFGKLLRQSGIANA
jgi:hypothetical protein